MTTRSRKTTSKSEDSPTAPEESPEEEPETEPETPEPPEEATAEEPKVEEAEPEPTDKVTLVYRGTADVARHGPFTFRPGQPVTVPSADAEELLTWPHERFERIDSQE